MVSGKHGSSVQPQTQPLVLHHSLSSSSRHLYNTRYDNGDRGDDNLLKGTKQRVVSQGCDPGFQVAQGCDVSSTPLTASLDWIEFSRIKRGAKYQTSKTESGQSVLHRCGGHICSTVCPAQEKSTIQSVRCHKLSLSQCIFLAWEQKLHQIWT